MGHSDACNGHNCGRGRRCRGSCNQGRLVARQHTQLDVCMVMGLRQLAAITGVEGEEGWLNDLNALKVAIKFLMFICKLFVLELQIRQNPTMSHLNYQFISTFQCISNFVPVGLPYLGGQACAGVRESENTSFRQHIRERTEPVLSLRLARLSWSVHHQLIPRAPYPTPRLPPRCHPSRPGAHTCNNSFLGYKWTDFDRIFTHWQFNRYTTPLPHHRPSLSLP